MTLAGKAQNCPNKRRLLRLDKANLCIANWAQRDHNNTEQIGRLCIWKILVARVKSSNTFYAELSPIGARATTVHGRVWLTLRLSPTKPTSSTNPFFLGRSPVEKGWQILDLIQVLALFLLWQPWYPLSFVQRKSWLFLNILLLLSLGCCCLLFDHLSHQVSYFEISGKNKTKPYCRKTNFMCLTFSFGTK